jgi:hypothetical protein
MPGDELVKDFTFDATRAVTINAHSKQIWPWIIQIGYRKAGFYSYDWLDNDGIASAELIIPEYQNLAVGDAIPLGRSVDVTVEILEPDRFLVLLRTKPGDGVPIMSWTWGLYEQAQESTRLVTRLRVHLDSVTARLFWEAFEIVMMRKCLLGIKWRAETLKNAQSRSNKKEAQIATSPPQTQTYTG